MKGTLENIPYHVCGVKEPDHVMMSMTMHGTLEWMGDDELRITSTDRKAFKCPELMFNHHKCRHAVDDNNNRRQSPISIEQMWGTKWWPNCTFAFLLGVTEVNILLVFHHLCGEEICLSKRINWWLLFKQRKRKRVKCCHENDGNSHKLLTIPVGKIRGNTFGKQWEPSCSTKMQCLWEKN